MDNPLRRLLAAILLVLGLGVCALAAAQGGGDTLRPGMRLPSRLNGVPLLQFDHNTTGFVLDAAHARERCESCHTQGTFRGTPRNCSGCHASGGRAAGKTATHIPTTTDCNACHRAVSWTPASFQHRPSQGVAPGACGTCHSGVHAAQNARGKSRIHPPTSAPCDACHKTTTSWAGATFNHAGATPPVTGRCSNCHNGTTATGKLPSHLPTTASCDVCHVNTMAFAPAVMNHGGATGPVAAGNCATCHGGTYTAINALAKPPSHVATTAQCDTCHTSTMSWATARFNHATASPPVTGRCSNCHNGTSALGKPTTHVPTGAQCDTCHTNTSAFAPAVMSHSRTSGPVAAANCNSCHGGAHTAAGAVAKPATHVATALQCDSCHTTTAWKSSSFSHAGVAAGTCANCHNGTTATGKPALHLPTTQSCDGCHRAGGAWLPVITPYAHTGIATGTCATCHGGTYSGVAGKPAGNGHIPTLTPAGMPGNECSLCHSSTSSFATARMNHGTVQTSCATCHDSTSPYPGNMEKINRASHHGAGGKDCSSTGCHRPLGSKGRAYSSWN